MALVVDTLNPHEVGDAALLLAHAFATDPIITHYLHDPIRREHAFPAFFRVALESLLPSGHTLALRSDSRLIGVAAWQPPEPVEPDASAIARAAEAERVVRELFPHTVDELFGGFVELEQHHPHEPHWYLAFIGLDPARRGEGLGRMLMAPIIDTADQTNTTCYLETPFPQTYPFYEGLGFVRLEEHWCFAGAPSPAVSLVRPATGNR